MENCGSDPARAVPCNLHGAWDDGLIAHRNLDDRAFLKVLESRLTNDRLLNQPVGTPADWAIESLTLSNAIMNYNALEPGTAVGGRLILDARAVPKQPGRVWTGKIETPIDSCG